MSGTVFAKPLNRLRMSPLALTSQNEKVLGQHPQNGHLTSTTRQQNGILIVFRSRVLGSVLLLQIVKLRAGGEAAPKRVFIIQ